MHGQVKQAANFAFARVYYSGHEVPFYQPLLALELFNRSISGVDIATGEVVVAGRGGEYATVGTGESAFREGNATVRYAVLPADAVYDVDTGAPAGNGTA